MRCDNPRLDWLMKEFRLITNKSIRIAIRTDVRSRTRLAKAAYSELRREHNVYSQYLPSAFEVALSLLKAHRRRVRKGGKSSTPFLRRPMLKMENQSYRLDRETGRLRIPIRGTEGVQFNLPLCRWHRSFLNVNSWKLGSLTLVPGRILLVVRKQAPKAYEPTTAIAMDTNEDSLDGVVATPTTSRLLSVPFFGVRQVQATHFRRRRHLSKKKACDRRVQRALAVREGRREHSRVRQRLHRVSKGLVQAAAAARAVIILENMTLHNSGGRSRRMNRRLSSWPRGELHRQIEYKAALAGVPIIKVNPAWTSKTCPVCGARRRDRVGPDFVCEMCDWEMDRQHNAGLNILKSALASNEALARAVRFQPGALRHDVVSPLCNLPALLAGAREEPSGVELAAPSAAPQQNCKGEANLPAVTDSRTSGGSSGPP